MPSPRDYFEQLSGCQHKGVQGVLRIDAQVGGPTLGIGIGTHGNEIEGLAAFEALAKLKRGTVILALCNIEAMKQHFDGSRSARYIDTNMNRLPAYLFKDPAGDASLEVLRARELLPACRDFDYALDIHSTPGPSEPMAIHVKGNGLGLVPRAPILLSGLLRHQEGLPLSAHFGYSNSTVAGVEAGQQGTLEAWENARKIVEDAFAVLGMSNEDPPEPPKQVHYEIVGSVYFPDSSYKFLPRLLTGSTTSLRKGTCPKVLKGETIAYGDGPLLKAAEDGILLFPRRGVSDLTDEAAFLARRVTG